MEGGRKSMEDHTWKVFNGPGLDISIITFARISLVELSHMSPTN